MLDVFDTQTGELLAYVLKEPSGDMPGDECMECRVEVKLEHRQVVDIDKNPYQIAYCPGCGWGTVLE